MHYQIYGTIPQVGVISVRRHSSFESLRENGFILCMYNLDFYRELTVYLIAVMS